MDNLKAGQGYCKCGGGCSDRRTTAVLLGIQGDPEKPWEALKNLDLKVSGPECVNGP